MKIANAGRKKAVWSEKAFRERGQWMQWYLRIAGAFELAIACLVEYQGGNNYRWERDNQTQKPILQYQEQNQNSIELCSCH